MFVDTTEVIGKQERLLRRFLCNIQSSQPRQSIPATAANESRTQQCQIYIKSRYQTINHLTSSSAQPTVHAAI